MAGLIGTEVINPLSKFSANGYGNVNTGLPSFISNIITIIFIAGGLYAFFNLMISGFSFITAGGDQKKIDAATQSINMSLMGLVVMVAAAAVTGIVSYVLFGSASAILTPKIIGPGSFTR
ncbi:MAG: hypothetical protein WAV40_03105 [Microgenomates group bacterium]